MNASVVADVCRRLDGIPLAIELAAARVKVLSVEEILSKLDDRFRLLTGGKKALPRHQTLWSVFEWSYDHLTADEQRLFRLLSVFAGGWTLAAATAVSSQAPDEFEVLELLTHLVDKSLVVVERVAAERVRYRLLETSRQFAQQKLNDAGEGEAERRRHLEYFVTWAEAREPLAVGPQRGKWLLDMGSEHQNVLAALDWCDGAAGGAEQALRLVAAVWRYWPTRGLSALGRERLTQALEASGRRRRPRQHVRGRSRAPDAWPCVRARWRKRVRCWRRVSRSVAASVTARGWRERSTTWASPAVRRATTTRPARALKRVSPWRARPGIGGVRPCP